ncbi:MAG: hypothetical protein ACRD2S_02255 [Terriglobales bacterium]
MRLQRTVGPDLPMWDAALLIIITIVGGNENPVLLAEASERGSLKENLQ